MIRYLSALAIYAILFAGCGTVTKHEASNETVNRNPSSDSELKWETSEIKDEDIENAANRAIERVEENRRRNELFNSCEARDFVSRAGLLERDLLLIRINSWSRERFERMYRKSLTPRSRDCLWNSKVGV